MNRRDFLTTSTAAGLSAAATSVAAQPERRGRTLVQPDPDPQPAAGLDAAPAPFKLKYAPHEGHFRQSAGNDYLDQIRFAADQGFTAWEDNGMMRRDPAVQQQAGDLLADRGMTMGVFVASADFSRAGFASGSREDRQALVDAMAGAVECAERVQAKWCTVVPGTTELRLEPGYQMNNAADTLKAMAEACEPSGLVMVLEPLNHINHPGLFLTHIHQAYTLCKLVGSPSVKILDDLYHQQITEGDLIRNLDRAWDEIAYIQVGDNPGRNEPTTGEINYKNIFKHLHDKGYDGVIGMEHGKSTGGPEGEAALIQAYREVDDFEVSG